LEELGAAFSFFGSLKGKRKVYHFIQNIVNLQLSGAEESALIDNRKNEIWNICQVSAASLAATILALYFCKFCRS